MEVYLTKLGGGAFGNNIDWIVKSIKNILLKYNE